MRLRKRNCWECNKKGRCGPVSIKKNIAALAIITMALALTSCQLTDFTKEDYVSGISVFRKTGQKTPKGSKSKKHPTFLFFTEKADLGLHIKSKEMLLLRRKKLKKW